jgi:hypothetical protein
MQGNTRDKRNPSAVSTAAVRARPRRFGDSTDYDHRNFVNLAAVAFILALGLGIAWTVKALDRHILLEKCLDSGRKECRQIGNPGIRGYVSLAR